MNTYQYALETRIGAIYLTASDKGLRGLYWKRQSAPMVEGLDGNGAAQKVLRRAARQIGEYLEGKRKAFDLELDFAGTPFQEAVWKALREIPFGETWSYKQLAARIKNPGAVRAVGSANGKNPICIIIPCHRVIASDGTIGGYAGGVPIKAKLLDLERN
jgi:methylated-DNA-[protein]-cysteine S-methyltransferase